MSTYWELPLYKHTRAVMLCYRGAYSGLRQSFTSTGQKPNSASLQFFTVLPEVSIFHFTGEKGAPPRSVHQSCSWAGWEHRSQNAWNPKVLFVRIWINAVKHILVCLPGKALWHTSKLGKGLGLVQPHLLEYVLEVSKHGRAQSLHSVPTVLPPELQFR